MKFRIEYIFASERPVTILTRQLDAGDFTLTEAPRLGGVPIQRTLTQPRAQKPDGSPDSSVYMFKLTDARNVREFSVGQVIELE